MELTISGNQEKTGYICAVLAAVMFGSVSTIAKPLALSVNPLLLSTLVGLVAAAIVLNEKIDQFQIIAAGMMIFGVYLLNRK